MLRRTCASCPVRHGPEGGGECVQETLECSVLPRGGVSAKSASISATAAATATPGASGTRSRPVGDLSDVMSQGMGNCSGVGAWAAGSGSEGCCKVRPSGFGLPGSAGAFGLPTHPGEFPVSVTNRCVQSPWRDCRGAAGGAGGCGRSHGDEQPPPNTESHLSVTNPCALSPWRELRRRRGRRRSLRSAHSPWADQLTSEKN